MKLMTILLQLALFIGVSPFLSGLISKIKNNLRMRRGMSVFQPYYNLAKLFSKSEVISENASWIFKLTPFVVISSALTASLLVPVIIFSNPLVNAGDFLALIFILALGRFFLVLAGLDTASSFGGMGSSREMFISSLAEPALYLAVFAISLRFGSTSLVEISQMHTLSASLIVAASALFLVTLAETSRIPVDNQETHLELTMIHEAMVLEYSGKRLALIELSAYLKQMILFFLIAGIIFPIAPFGAVNFTQSFFWLAWFLARIFIIGLIVSVLEVSVAKMRLFRAADFLGFAFVLGIVAVICAILGV
jgi:formate hydrogenlyase subunit 4